MSTEKTVVYIPSLPSLSSDDLDLYKTIHASRVDLVTQLAGKGFKVEDIDGQRPWLKTMMQHADHSQAFVFPPMTSLKETHPRYKSEAAQRWFEFFSLTTGVHVGSREKYLNGISKPCIVMDPDHQWESALDLLRDLQKKGMFSSQVEDIVQVVRDGDPAAPGYSERLNEKTVSTLQQVMAEKRGKTQRAVHYKYPEDHKFEPFRKEIARHPFGIALFGSATTQEKSYQDAAYKLAELAGQRGWRMVTGAGVDGCMGAADKGFEAGKNEFNLRYRHSPFKPSHIGVSTQSILRLEGPPKHLDQLIITNDIYDRMEVMIRGHKSSDPLARARDAVKVAFVVPGGTGTLHEFATMMQLATNGSMMKQRKIVLLNMPSHLDPSQGFWDPLIATAKKLGFDNNFEVAHSPEEAIAIADRTYKEWLGRHPEHEQLAHPVFNPNVRFNALPR